MTEILTVDLKQNGSGNDVQEYGGSRLQKEYDDYWERLHEKELAQWLTEREEEEKNKGYTSY